MAKKKLTERPVRDMNSTLLSQTEDKFSTDLSGGRKPLEEFMLIPVSQIIPFQQKSGKDFSRPASGPDSGMVETIRKLGVIEPVTVRPYPASKQFELLAGETRWLASQAAGLDQIPAHVMHVDDARAHEIFFVTNLFRRDLKPLDRVYGWWHYYQSLKMQGREKELDYIIKDDVVVQEAGANGEAVSSRQIRYYIRMNELPQEWLDRYGEGKLTLRSGSLLLNFPDELKRELLNYTFTEREFEELYRIYNGTDRQGREWTPKWIPLLLHPIDGTNPSIADDAPELKKEVENSVRFNKIKRFVVRAAQTRLRPEDYDDAERVIGDALLLYYKNKDQHGAPD